MTQITYQRTQIARRIIQCYVAIFVLLDFSTCYGRNLRRSSRESSNENNILYMAVSSTKNTPIVINWNLTNPPNEIRFYTGNPQQSETIQINGTKEGFHITNTSFSQDSIPVQWWQNSTGSAPKGRQCLNYSVIALKNGKKTITECLAIQPTWMKDNGDVIGDTPLAELLIPGTHNSGCFDSEPEEGQLDIINKYIYNQDRNIWTQLIFGIRYLDFRIAYYNTTYKPDSFWINHDIFNLNSLVEVLRDIKLFLQRAEDEIVIVDMHRFPVGFKNRTTHKRLMDFLHEEIGEIAIPRSFQKSPSGPTLNEIWQQKRRLIICYADKTTAINSDYLWDPLSQKWGDKQKVDELKKYLEEVQSKHKPANGNALWASMAELTPNTASIFFEFWKPQGSLAKKVDDVNRNVTSWFRHQWCFTANIVATDYFLGNDIINIAINCNLLRAKNNKVH